MGLSFTIAVDPRQRCHSQVRVPRDSWSCVRFETSPTWRARSPYLYPPGTGWPSYTPRHWVPFSSPPMTRKAVMEVFEPTSTRLNSSVSCLQDNSSARTTQKTQPLYCCRGVFTAPLHSNGRCADRIENTVLLLLHACMLRALASNGRCLQSHCLATDLYATIYCLHLHVRITKVTSVENSTGILIIF
jgi:hypothetical protein